MTQPARRPLKEKKKTRQLGKATTEKKKTAPIKMGRVAVGPTRLPKATTPAEDHRRVFPEDGLQDHCNRDKREFKFNEDLLRISIFYSPGLISPKVLIQDEKIVY